MPTLSNFPVEQNLVDRPIVVMAEETGSDVPDILPTADFASMGVDSPMGFTIIPKPMAEGLAATIDFLEKARLIKY
ncbi:hypothetical protein BJX76DRAFT_339192 [Aspergillus varians]